MNGGESVGERPIRCPPILANFLDISVPVMYRDSIATTFRYTSQMRLKKAWIDMLLVNRIIDVLNTLGLIAFTVAVLGMVGYLLDFMLEFTTQMMHWGLVSAMVMGTPSMIREQWRNP